MGQDMDLISQQPSSKALAKRRSVLSDSKFGPGDGPNWAVGQTRYPNFQHLLAQERDPKTRKGMVKSRLVLVCSRQTVQDIGTVSTQ